MTCNIRRTWSLVDGPQLELRIGAMERMVVFPQIRHRGPGLRAPGSYSVLINHALHLYYLFHLSMDTCHRIRHKVGIIGQDNAFPIVGAVESSIRSSGLIYIARIHI